MNPIIISDIYLYLHHPFSVRIIRRKEDEGTNPLNKRNGVGPSLKHVYSHAVLSPEQLPARHGPCGIRKAAVALSPLTPAQQREAPKAAATANRQQQRVEIPRLHQQPGEITHHTVMTEHDRRLTGCLHEKDKRELRKETNLLIKGSC